MDIAVLRDAVIALSVGYVAYALGQSLAAWRSEIEGKAGAEAVKNLMRSAHGLRNAVRDCRSPLLRTDEYPEGYGSGGAMPDRHFYAHIFDNRWKAVAHALHHFQTQAIDASTLVGSQFRSIADECGRYTTTLRFAIERYIDNEDKLEAGLMNEVERSRSEKNIVFSGNKNDHFTEEFESFIEDLELLAKPLLEPKKSKGPFMTFVNYLRARKASRVPGGHG